MTDQTESDINRLRAGDEQAFAALVREHHRALLAVATSLVGQGDAEEVVQNSWIKAHRSLAGFEGRSALRTWLTRIVINEGKMWLRKQQRDLPRQTAVEDTAHPLADRFTERGTWAKPPVAWHGDSPEGLLMVRDLADCLRRLLRDMPLQQRSLLEMRDASGLPFDDICNELAITASNARVLLHRARNQLFRLVDHYEETGEC